MKSAGWMRAVILCGALFATTVHADDREQAERYFQAGLTLQKVDDFEAAIPQYQASLRLFPTKSALFNLANCLRATHRYAEALDALERLEREFAAELPGSARNTVVEQREELSRLVGFLEVRVIQNGEMLAGAEVQIDGRRVGTTPLHDPIRLSLGSHELSASFDSQTSAIALFEVSPGKVSIAELTLEPSAPSPALVPEPAPPTTVILEPNLVPEPPPPPGDPNREANDGSSSYRVWAWATTATGAALLAGGATTGILALSLDSELERQCTSGVCPIERTRDVDRLNTLTTTTNVLLGLGIATAGTGVLMLLLDSGQPEPNDSSIDVSVGSGFVGARLWRKF